MVDTNSAPSSPASPLLEDTAQRLTSPPFQTIGQVLGWSASWGFKACDGCHSRRLPLDGNPVPRPRFWTQFAKEDRRSSSPRATDGALPRAVVPGSDRG